MNNEELLNNFEKIYSTQIFPYVKSLEEYRINERNKFYIYIALIFATFFVTGSFALSIGVTISMLVTIIWFIIFGSIFVKIAPKVISIPNELRKKLKKELLTPILNIFGDFNVTDEEVITEGEISSTGLYGNIKTKDDDDKIKGIYKGVSIEIVETALACFDSDCYNFNGLIIKLRSNKNFNCNVSAKSKINMKNIVTINSSYVTFNTPIMNLGKNNFEKITFEDSEFNKEFTVRSDNQVEARYLITPTFIEKIKEIKKETNVSCLDFAFKNGYFYLFLGNLTTEETQKQINNYNGLFEIGSISKTILDKKIYFKVYKELLLIFSIIDCFKLDEKTGL